MLILDRRDLPAAQGWRDALRVSGVRLDYRVVEGFVQMLLTEPHLALTPEPVLAATLEWLKGLATSSQSSASRASAAHPQIPQLLLPGPAARPQEQITEHATILGAEPPLFAIVTLPRKDEARRRGVIILNDGATDHVGSSRMGVSLARQWARRGYVVMRLDLEGLGESGSRPGRPVNEVFPIGAMDNVRSALTLLEQVHGVRDVALVGMCSGAHHALRAAASGLRVTRLLMVNPMHFFWHEALVQGDVEFASVIHDARRYRERALSADSFNRLVTGRANYPRIVRIVFQRLWSECVGLVSVAHEFLRRGEQGEHSKEALRRFNLLRKVNAFNLGRELERIAAHGTRMVFVFSREDPGIDLLHILAGPAVHRLRDWCCVHVIDGADHIFSRSDPRAILEQTLGAELFARVGGDGPVMRVAEEIPVEELPAEEDAPGLGRAN
jgi:hypothetical protein